MSPKKTPKKRPPVNKGSAKARPANEIRHAEKAPAWQGTQRRQTRRAADIFDGISYADNAGERAWRRREPPECTIKLPRRLLNLKHQDEYRNIARQYDAFIDPVDNCEFGVWAGSAANAQHAKHALDAWAKQADDVEEGRGGGHAKLRSFTPEAQEKMHKKWQTAVRRHIYRQCPLPGSSFGAIATFYWPAEELDPREALGMSLEALDPIRMEHSCYIFEDDDASQIKILGSAKKVPLALLDIRQTFFQLIARQQTTETAYLLHWTKQEEIPDQVAVQLVPSDATQSQEAGASYNVEDWSDGHSDVPALTTSRLTTILHDNMKDLVYFSAKINFQIRLGVFSATSFLRPDNGQHSLYDFGDMLVQSQFAGMTVPALLRRSWQDNMHKRIRKAARIIPWDSTVEHCEDVQPEYTAKFVFVSGNDGTHELVVTWHSDSSGKVMPPLPSEWSRLDTQTQSRTSLLDVHLLRLDTGVSWHFDINAANIVPRDRLPMQLQHFAERVKFRPKSERTQGQPFVSFAAIAGCGLKSLTTAMTYKYLVKDSDYHLECAETQTFDYLASVPALRPTRIHPIIKALTVNHPNWAADLSANANLRIGKVVNWSPDLDRWLPTSNAAVSGIDTLLDTLTYVEKIVACDMDDSLGMAIG